MGCAMMLAGLGLAYRRGWVRPVGVLGLAAGALTLLTLLSVGTALESAGGVLFMPALALTGLFRFLAGAALWRGMLKEET
jgi:hypothetical protein